MKRVVFSLLLLVALAVPASAQAVWNAPVTLGLSAGSVQGPQAAVDQNGNAVFVWHRRDETTDCGGQGCLRVKAVARSATGTVSAVQTLSDPGGDALVPQVAIDPNGNAAFAWSRRDGTTDCGGSGCYRAQARARSANGTLSPVQTLSASGQDIDLYSPRLAVDQSGNAIFVWSRRDGTTDCGSLPGCYRVQARARSANGTLSAVQVLSAPRRSAQQPQVAVDQSGNAVFVWRRPDETTTDCGSPGCDRIQTRVRSAAGTLSAVQTLSDPGRLASTPQVAVDQGGNAVFVWRRYVGTTGCRGGGCLLVQTRARSAAGTVSPVQTLSDPGRWTYDPLVAVDQTGNAVYVWTSPDGTTDCAGPPGCDRVVARARSANGNLSATQTLSDPGRPAGAFGVGVDQSGTAVFLWVRRDETTGCGGSGCRRVQSTTRSVAGAFGAVQTLSDAGQTANLPDLAVNPTGDAVAVWRRGINLETATGP